MNKLLNIDANPKTVKGQKAGYMTAVLYLAPYKASGINVCPLAELAGCWEGCLNTAGRGGIAKGSAVIATDAGEIPDNAIQHARIRRTRFYAEDRNGFMRQIVKEITAFIRKAERADLIPAIRLNGTSDIQFEIRHPVEVDGKWYESIFEAFPDVQFYDYTKIAKRLRRDLPENYQLTLSHSGADSDYAAASLAAHRSGASVAVVVRDKALKAELLDREPSAIDGDLSDLRFKDPAGALVVLTAKGRARQDVSGFVVDELQAITQ